MIKPYSIRRCLIKDSKKIKNLLHERIKELDLYNKQVVADSIKHGYRLTECRLSRYFNHGNVPSSLSQEDIIWLCLRYGIDIKLVSAQITPYDEKDCLKRLKSYFK